jgi:hypothetical protein
MPKYEYVGDHPVSIPALGLDVVPGDVVEVADEIRHSDFVLIPEKKAAAKGGAKEE